MLRDQKACVKCGSLFTPWTSATRFCSRTCASRFNSTQQRLRRRERDLTKPCEKCGVTDWAVHWGERIRCRYCRWAMKTKNRILIDLPIKTCRCGTVYRPRRRNQRWCTAKCTEGRGVENYKKNRLEIVARARQWRLDHPEEYKAKLKRDSRIKRLAKYGLTEADYELMFNRQGGACALCGKKPKAGNRLVIDHSHKTGKVRGLICDRCNHGVGHFRDNPILMRRAAKYITQDVAKEGWLPGEESA